MSDAVKTVSFDPLSTASSDLLASGGDMEGGAEEALEALDVMESMSEDGFFGRGEGVSKTSSPPATAPAMPEKESKLSTDERNLLSDQKSIASIDQIVSNIIVEDKPVIEQALTNGDQMKEMKEDDAESIALSSCLGTESLIASGCAFTILEQFFRPTRKTQGGVDDGRANITDTLKEIADHLAKISVSLDTIASSSSSKTETTDQQ